MAEMEERRRRELLQSATLAKTHTHCFLCAFEDILIAAFLLVFWWVLAGALDLKPLAKGTAWAGLCAIHNHDDDGELLVRASAVLKS